jgi:hypothetical protein
VCDRLSAQLQALLKVAEKLVEVGSLERACDDARMKLHQLRADILVLKGQRDDLAAQVRHQSMMMVVH